MNSLLCYFWCLLALGFAVRSSLSDDSFWQEFLVPVVFCFSIVQIICCITFAVLVLDFSVVVLRWDGDYSLERIFVLILY